MAKKTVESPVSPVETTEVLDSIVEPEEVITPVKAVESVLALHGDTWVSIAERIKPENVRNYTVAKYLKELNKNKHITKNTVIILGEYSC